jgi:Putative Ig domain
MMRRSALLRTLFVAIAFYCTLAPVGPELQADPLIIDHNHTDIALIPQSAIESAKSKLHIAYGHTSHGSQLTTGMTGLIAFANGGGAGLALPADIFAWNDGGTGGALDLHDYAMGGDVGYYPQWVDNTRAYLDNPDHADVNVIIWSWCGQVDDKYAAGTLDSEYLTPMAQLEAEYPNVKFVYMTGHVDIWDDADNKAANQMIRDFCTANDKILYDFADIEHYDPDGTYFQFVNDNCDYYDGPGGNRLGNWATEWQQSHIEGVDWYNCSAAHSQPLNANRKAYAAWWLWAALAGWNASGINRAPVLQAIGDRDVAWGQLLEFTISASDPDSGDVLAFSCGPLPAGASFNAATATFSWSPAAEDKGDHQVAFYVRDDGSPQGSDQESITISVNAPGTTPIDGTSSTDAASSTGDSGGSSGCFINSLAER